MINDGSVEYHKYQGKMGQMQEDDEPSKSIR